MTNAVRSILTAGVIAASVSAVTVMPVAGPSAVTAASAAVRLAAAVDTLTPEPTPFVGADPLTLVEPTANPISDFIVNAYDLVEPWVAYGFELADYVLSFVPGLWWIAPAIDLAYFSIEPLVQAGVYSFAALLDGDFAAIGPIIQVGITEAVDNFVFYGLAWIGSLIPLPPLPPFPPFPPFAAATEAPSTPAAGRGVAAAAATVAEAEAVTGDQAPDAVDAATEVAASVATAASPRSTKANARLGSRTAPSAPAPADIEENQKPAALGADDSGTESTDATSTDATSTEPASATKRGGADRGAAKAGRPAR